MGEGVSDWTPILEKHTTLTGHTKVHILNTKAIHAKLKSGDQKRISNKLELALSTLRTTLILTSTQEHRKLPKPIITYKVTGVQTCALPISILEKHTTPTGHTEVHILNTKAIHAKLNSGDQKRISNNLEFALSTLRTNLILPTTQ